MSVSFAVYVQSPALYICRVVRYYLDIAQTVCLFQTKTSLLLTNAWFEFRPAKAESVDVHLRRNKISVQYKIFWYSFMHSNFEYEDLGGGGYAQARWRIGRETTLTQNDELEGELRSVGMTIEIKF